jgi:hypothetical protein
MRISDGSAAESVGGGDLEIYLDLIDELSPGVIKIAGPFLYALMPVRL